MSYFIYPYKGFSIDENYIINFGMRSKDIKDVLGEKFECQQDSFEYYKDFRIDYNKQEEAIAFEFFSSSIVIMKNNELPLLNNVNLFSYTKNKINKILMSYDKKIILDGASTISLKYGVGTYGEEKKCETIIIFKQGYYDNIF